MTTTGDRVQIDLDVYGMTCVHCVQHVTDALAGVSGVMFVDVPGWQSGKATLVAAADVADDALSNAAVAAGYKVRVVARRSAEEPDVEIADSGYDLDLLVIGGGSGGFAAAIVGSELGARVGLVNDGTLGGTCVNVGCVPSKTLIRTAEAWHQAGHHPFDGVGTRQGALDWDAVRRQKDALVSELRQTKYADVLAAYPEITFIPGWARFQADGSVLVEGRILRAHKYVITTGAQPRLLPIPGAEEAGVLTSTTLMELEQLPQSLIVLGGRAVALELGQTMVRFGVRVTILQRSDRLIPAHEPEISTALQDYLEEEGIEVVTGVRVERIERDGDERVVRVHVRGHSRVYRTEQVLMALGRQPNTSGMGLKKVGIDLDDRGAIIVDGQMRTSHPDVYASGDCTTNPEYVYVAAAGGAIAAGNALKGVEKALDLAAMPAVIFTDPQVAMVGLTEAQAQSQGYDVRISELPLSYVPRALAARDTRGLIKLVADGATGRLLGAHILAAQGGEVVQTAVLAVKFGLTIDDLTGTLFPYLTQVEGLKLAAQTFDKDVAKLSCCAA